MRVRVWGSRGSIAKPGQQTLRYGGNTACMEVRADSGELVVIDCGTGAHALGQALMAGARGPLRGALLISHTHWDHIQGLPFFAPLFARGGEWDVYAPRGLGQSLAQTLSGQMQYEYFPLRLEELGAAVRFHELVEGAFAIGGVAVTAQYLDHTALTLGYRIEADGASFVYASDHEPPSRVAAPGRAELDGPERRHVAFLRDADLVLHDAQFLAAEYPARIGWGHGTPDYAVAVCREAGVRRLLLGHHDPMRGDDAVDAIVAAARATAGDLAVDGAAEGVEYALSGPDRAAPTDGDEPARLDVGRAVRDQRLALQGVLADAAAVLRRAAAAEALPLAEGDAAADAALIACGDAAADDPRRADARVLRIIGRDAPAPDGDGEPPMVWPFSQQYAQSRLRAAALRQRCRWVRAPMAPDEPARQAALDALALLETPSDPRFERLARMAATAFRTPLALVSLIDHERQWLRACFGGAPTETAREAAFCAHTILEPDALVVPDTLLDDRFADNPFAAGGPRVRFYAGCPLRAPSGHAVGSFCVIDVRPRGFAPDQVALLRDFAALAERELATPPATGGGLQPAGAPL